MNPWAINPTWQNYSSLVREATTARMAKTGMERSHHLTASLYFGIAALEAFLNQKMRDALKSRMSEGEIVQFLRKGQIIDKIKKWPIKLINKPPNLSEGILDLLISFNDVRGNLTHPKTEGRDIYEQLETIDPDSVVNAVAEYIVRFHEAEGTRYPYWIFGWNYLNPRPNSYEIFIINDQQFTFSLQAIGFQVPAGSYGDSEAWLNKYLGAYEGYRLIHKELSKLDRCEPKSDRFPFKPVLCRRWWALDHQQSCGHVTEESLNFVRNYEA
jgi:hypothetical protein